MNVLAKSAPLTVHFDGEIDALLPLNDDTEVVDAGFRGSSQERLMPRSGTFAQAYTGPMGKKQVVWQRGDRMPDELGEVVVWFNGVRSTDAAAQSAAALVAEATVCSCSGRCTGRPRAEDADWRHRARRRSYLRRGRCVAVAEPGPRRNRPRRALH